MSPGVYIEKVNPELNHIQILMLVPTRELALQTSAICKEIGKHLESLEVMVTTGGTNLRDDIMRLYSPVHIVVGTYSLFFYFYSFWMSPT